MPPLAPLDANCLPENDRLITPLKANVDTVPEATGKQPSAGQVARTWKQRPSPRRRRYLESRNASPNLSRPPATPAQSRTSSAPPPSLEAVTVTRGREAAVEVTQEARVDAAVTAARLAVEAEAEKRIAAEVTRLQRETQEREAQEQREDQVILRRSLPLCISC